jgi:hypothetical protein
MTPTHTSPGHPAPVQERNQVKRKTLALFIAAGLGVTAMLAPRADAGSGRTTNAKASTIGILTSDYCYAAKLSEPTALLRPNTYTTTYNNGFKVTTGRYYKATKNGVAWISKVKSLGNAVCYADTNNVTVTVLS